MNAWSQAAMSALSAAAVHAAAVTPVDLRCEYLENPQGIDAPAPRLQCRLQADMDVRGITQTAYQIVVDGAWDSGKVTSARSVNVAYAGKPLEPGQLYWWKVRVWDGRDEPSAWSAGAS